MSLKKKFTVFHCFLDFCTLTSDLIKHVLNILWFFEPELVNDSRMRVGHIENRIDKQTLHMEFIARAMGNLMNIAIPNILYYIYFIYINIDRKKDSRKSGSESGFRKSCLEKRKNFFNPKAAEYEQKSFNASAKKLEDKKIFMCHRAQTRFFATVNSSAM